MNPPPGNLSAPVPPSPGPGSISASPSFLLALRGIWLFTWRTQLSWERFPAKAAGLLVLPALIYFTTLTAQKYAQKYSPLGDPLSQVNRLARRMARAAVPLSPEQRTQMAQIFNEEFSSAAKTLPPAESPQGDETSRQVRACYSRIGERLKGMLNERQLAQFQNFETFNLNLSEARAREPRWDWTAPFYHWLIDFYFFVMLPLTCVRTSGALIRDELQADTLGFLLTRPLSRGRLLILKYLTQTAWLQIVLLIETMLVFAVGEIRHIPNLAELLPLFVGVQLLAVLAWSALGTAFGLVSSRYVALALVYGLIVEMGIGRIPTNINTLSIMRHLKTLLAHNPALQGIYDWSGSGILLSIGALAAAALIFLGIAVLLFTWREYHRATEMPK